MLSYDSVKVVADVEQNRELLGNLDLVEDDAIKALLEPLHRLLLSDLMIRAKRRAGDLALRDTSTRAGELDIEVHTVDTGGRVVLDTEINMLLNTEAKVASVREVLSANLVLLDLEALLENLLSLLTANSGIAGHLFITTNAERADSVASLGEHGLLLSERLENLSSLGQSVTRLTYANVHNKLLDADVPHGIRLSLHHRAIYRSTWHRSYIFQLVSLSFFSSSPFSVRSLFPYSPLCTLANSGYPFAFKIYLVPDRLA